MEVKVKRLPQSKIEMEIEVPVEVLKKARAKALAVLGKEMKIDGFRPGSIPEDVVEKRAGEANILSEAARIAMEESYRKAVDQEKLEPISQPDVQVLKLAPGNPFSFKATFFVLPKMELPNYEKIVTSVKKEKVLINEKEIAQTLSWLQKSRASFSQIERDAKKGDFIEIEFSSLKIKNGEKQKDAFILGESHLLKEFEASLVGMKNGQEKDFEVTFPKDYKNKEMAGKKIPFWVKVLSVKEVKMPELNDDFIKTLGKFETVAELKENIRKGLLQEKEQNEKWKRREKIMEKIEKAISIELPPPLIKAEKDKRFHDLKHRISDELKISYEDYLSQIKKTEEELLKLLEIEAIKGSKRFLFLREIAKIKNIVVSEKEIEEESNRFLARYSDSDETKEKIDLNRLKSYTEERLKNEKVFELLESFK